MIRRRAALRGSSPPLPLQIDAGGREAECLEGLGEHSVEVVSRCDAGAGVRIEVLAAHLRHERGHIIDDGRVGGGIVVRGRERSDGTGFQHVHRAAVYAINARKREQVERFVKALAGKRLSVRDIERLAQAYFQGPDPLREAIESRKLDWSLQQLKGVPEDREGLTRWIRTNLMPFTSCNPTGAIASGRFR